MTCIGIDNGVTGAIGSREYGLVPMPTTKGQDYTKKKQNVSRVDARKLISIFKDYGDIFLVIERPMVNPGRFKATKSALRCLESILVVCDLFDIPYAFIDSKEWQKYLLPKGIKGPELKRASSDIGKRLFPEYSEAIDKQGDADALLIHEYAVRNNWGGTK